MRFTLTALLLAKAIAFSFARCNISMVSPAKSIMGQFNNKGSQCTADQVGGLKCPQRSRIQNTDGAEDVRLNVCATDTDYAADVATLKARGIFFGA
jgi:hypothetical protein